MDLKRYLLFLVITLSAILRVSGIPTKRPVCGCTCPSINKSTVCDTLAGLVGEVHANVIELQRWAKYRQFVERFSRDWRGEIADIVETMINDYIARGNLHGIAENLVENLVEKPEDEMLNDSILVRPIEEDSDLAKNVSSLLEKVEMVENRTKVVENELETERRERRDLEEKVNLTHNTLVLIEDQLLNVSAPADAILTELEVRLNASLDDLNNTYEDHLKKLYYQIDGVAYKNETEKLYERLEIIESQEHQCGCNSSCSDECGKKLKYLEGNLYNLSRSIEDDVVPRLDTLSSSVEEVLIPRVNLLEEDTLRKDAALDLEDKMKTLIYDTESIKRALEQVQLNVQDVEGLETKFQTLSQQVSGHLDAMQKQIASLKNVKLNETVKCDSDADISIVGLSKIVRETTTDITEPCGRRRCNREFESFVEASPGASTFGEEPEVNDISQLKTIYLMSPEASPVGEGSEANDISDFGTLYGSSPDASPAEEEPEANYVSDFEPDGIAQYLSAFGKPSSSGWNNDSTDCGAPVSDDPHLLVDVVQNADGKPALKFGCKPIGRYSVPPVPVPPRCERGSWRAPLPSCIELPRETAIKSLAVELLKEDPCKSDSGEFPDPTNCTQFFKCDHGLGKAVPCPHGLLFNAELKVCDYPRAAKCYSERSKNVEELQSLIPPIHIEPDNLDRVNSLLGTGETGELIVHPRSSFTLHCLYPESIYGPPKWEVTYSSAGVNSTVLATKKGDNKISLTATSAKEEDSGVYRCLTPFGQKHDIKVVVRAVVCPAILLEEDYEEVFYRPTPEGEPRILGTTAEVQCEEGHRATARCMANGKWSTEFPPNRECTLKKRNKENMWNCTPLDLSEHPDLITQRRDDEKIVTFKCSGRMRLLGSTFTRCLDDGSWSHTSLPRCKR